MTERTLMKMEQSVAVLIRLKAEQMRQAIEMDDMITARVFLRDIRLIVDAADRTTNTRKAN